MHHPEAEIQQIGHQLSRRHVRQIVRHKRRDDEPVQLVVAGYRKRLPCDVERTRAIVELERQPKVRGERTKGVFTCTRHYATSFALSRMNSLESAFA